jgi:hypothetical protein
MGVGITPEGYLAVADRYNHCIRLYKYKRDQSDCIDCLESGSVCPKCRDHQYMNKGWKGRRQATTRLNIREERARLVRKREQDRKRSVKTGGAELTVKGTVQIRVIFRIKNCNDKANIEPVKSLRMKLVFSLQICTILGVLFVYPKN